MNDEQFIKLFKYIEDFRREVNDRFEQTASRDGVDRLTNTVDKLAGLIQHYEIELAARDSKIDRLEKYIQVLAKKVGVDLDTISV